jgi:hypothetical protein
MYTKEEWRKNTDTALPAYKTFGDCGASSPANIDPKANSTDPVNDRVWVWETILVVSSRT